MKTRETPVSLAPKWARQVEDLLERLSIDIELDRGKLLLTQEELERDLAYGRAL
jgi:hypothetical protein